MIVNMYFVFSTCSKYKGYYAEIRIWAALTALRASYIPRLLVGGELAWV